jgi:hypothetical protein
MPYVRKISVEKSSNNVLVWFGDDTSYVKLDVNSEEFDAILTILVLALTHCRSVEVDIVVEGRQNVINKVEMNSSL